MSDTWDDASSPLLGLTSERRHPASHGLDRLSALEIIQLMNAEDYQPAAAIQHELSHIAQAISGIVARLRAGGRLIYVGAGTSGRLAAVDAAECSPTFNVDPDFVSACVAGGPIALGMAAEDAEDRAGQGTMDLLRREVSARDAVVGISASGRTPYVLGALTLAHERGSFTVGLACNVQAPMAGQVDVMIAPEVGPEIIAGSTRLKAGTAQKMVLNMLSTATMVLLGKTYDGLMVDVQATNTKLRARAASIVAEVVGVPVMEAQTLLRQAGGDVKAAIVIGRTGLSLTEAQARLEAHGRELRPALESDDLSAASVRPAVADRVPESSDTSHEAKER